MEEIKKETGEKKIFFSINDIKDLKKYSEETACYALLVKRKEFFLACPICGKELKGISEQTLRRNLYVHLLWHKKKEDKNRK